MAPLFNKNDRVKCLASRFDEGSEDRNGDVFSVRYARAGNGVYCFGSIAHVYALSSNPVQSYRVKYDDGESHKSIESHLCPADDADSGSDSGDSDVQQQAADDATDDNRDAVVTDSDNDDDPHALDGLELDKALEIGDETEVGGRKWVRVEKTPGDCAN